MSYLLKHHSVRGINQAIDNLAEIQITKIFDDKFECNTAEIRNFFADLYDKFEDLLESDEPEEVQRGKYLLSYLMVLFIASLVDDHAEEKFLNPMHDDGIPTVQINKEDFVNITTKESQPEDYHYASSIEELAKQIDLPGACDFITEEEIINISLSGR